jgi:hypothetical protein
MPKKAPGPSVKKPDTYEALRDKGHVEGARREDLQRPGEQAEVQEREEQEEELTRQPGQRTPRGRVSGPRAGGTGR